MSLFVWRGALLEEANTLDEFSLFQMHKDVGICMYIELYRKGIHKKNYHNLTCKRSFSESSNTFGLMQNKQINKFGCCEEKKIDFQSDGKSEKKCRNRKTSRWNALKFSSKANSICMHPNRPDMKKRVNLEQLKRNRNEHSKSKGFAISFDIMDFQRRIALTELCGYKAAYFAIFLISKKILATYYYPRHAMVAQSFLHEKWNFRSCAWNEADNKSHSPSRSAAFLMAFDKFLPQAMNKTYWGRWRTTTISSFYLGELQA